MPTRHKISCLLAAAAVLAVFAGPAAAEGRNMLSANAVNLRSGPGANYRHVATITKDQIVTVYGCARANSWCDVDWAGYRGWVSAKYLRLPGMTGGLAKLISDLGIPSVDYASTEYEAKYYAVSVEPAGGGTIQQAADDSGAVVLTDGPMRLPADNRDLLGGDAAK